MSDEFFPCELLELEPNSYSLLFTECERYGDYIRQEGGSGCGYSWEALISAVIDECHLNFPEVEFDSDTDRFTAASHNRLALRFIAAIVRELTANPELMASAVARAKRDNYFE